MSPIPSRPNACRRSHRVGSGGMVVVVLVVGGEAVVVVVTGGDDVVVVVGPAAVAGAAVVVDRVVVVAARVVDVVVTGDSPSTRVSVVVSGGATAGPSPQEPTASRPASSAPTAIRLLMPEEGGQGLPSPRLSPIHGR
ncbi:MAG: hypothetical protein OXI56_02685 [bacterium]|nr:hypothetical protein [bacterium]